MACIAYRTRLPGQNNTQIILQEVRCQGSSLYVVLTDKWVAEREQVIRNRSSSESRIKIISDYFRLPWYQVWSVAADLKTILQRF